MKCVELLIIIFIELFPQIGVFLKLYTKRRFSSKQMINVIVKNYYTLYFMARQQIHNQYSGTLLGMLWAIIHPILLLSVFWLVFTIGFKTQVVGDKPFLLVLFCGLVVWMPFGEALGGAVQSITGRAYLIKKIAFPMEILPLVSVAASMFSHFIAFVILMLMFLYYGYLPGIGLLTLPFYFFCLIFLLSGISWLLSAINVFYRDTSQTVSVILNLWFWATHIVWDQSMLPEKYNFILPPVEETLIFISIATAIWFVGTFVFSKLKSSFADVL